MTTEHSSVDRVDDDVVRQFARAAVLAALTGSSVVVTVPNPLSPAPYTLQVLFVFLAGLLLGPTWGGVSMVIYLAAGAVGLPVFSGMEAGIGVLFGPTGGYLWSYPIAAGLIGLGVHRGIDRRDPGEASLAVLAGVLTAATLLIYAMGVGYMAWVADLGLWEATLTSAVPFVPGELAKMAAAILVIKNDRFRGVRS